MRIIVLETSGSNGEVALADESGLLASRVLTMARRHARDMAPALKEMFGEAGWAASSIDLVLVGLGPGSYTGLRVSVTTAKTLAYVTGCAVIGAETMAVLAETAPASYSEVSVIVDAQQGFLYSALFRRTSPAGTLEPAAAGISIERAEDWAGALKPGVFVTGPGLDKLESLVPEGCVMAAAGQRDATAQALWSVGMRHFAAGRRDDYWALEPLYLRPSSAEQKWDKRTADGVA